MTQYLNMMSTNYILSIDTATPSCSVSLACQGKHMATIVSEEPNVHASHLTLFIDRLLKQQNVAMQELSAVAVSQGPGSYTGLRIGASTAKGLCYALDIPLIANGTLEGLYEGFIHHQTARSSQTLWCPMIDARRREVYTCIYDNRGDLLEPTHALIVDQHTFDVFVEQGHRLVLFGPGADKFVDTFKDNPSIEIGVNFPSLAQYQDALSYKRYKRRQFEDLAYFEPFYLKDFVATTPKKLPFL